LYPFALVLLIVFAAFSLYGYFELLFDNQVHTDFFQRPGIGLLIAIATVAWFSVFNAKLSALLDTLDVSNT
jgi:FtsH-binding integral membrane protein